MNVHSCCSVLFLNGENMHPIRLKAAQSVLLLAQGPLKDFFLKDMGQKVFTALSSQVPYRSGPRVTLLERLLLPQSTDDVASEVSSSSRSAVPSYTCPTLPFGTNIIGNSSNCRSLEPNCECGSGSESFEFNSNSR